MAISNNSSWNYGTIITPEKMNNIECSLDQIVMGAVNKKIVFEDNKISEYFGEIITTDKGNHQNQKITTFETNGNITEKYFLYFKPGNSDSTYVICKEYKKTTIFETDGSITETLEEVAEYNVGNN